MKRVMQIIVAAYCSCEQAYARILLLHLMRPLGLSPSEIELAAYWAWKWRETISFSKKFDANIHSHCIALADSLPPQLLHGQPVALDSARYWAIHGVIAKMNAVESDMGSTTKLIKLYGIPFDDNPNNLLQHIHTKLTSNTYATDISVFEIPAAVNISCGEQRILDAFKTPGKSQKIAAYYHATGHPTEAYYRLSFVSAEGTCTLKAHDLLISYDASNTNIQTLSAIRWMEEAASATVTLGMERLSCSPQIVQLHGIQDAISPSPFDASPEQVTLAVIGEASALTLVSFDHLKHRYYDMREGDYIFRIKVKRILEQKPDWVRVEFIRLTRRHQPI